MGLGYSRRSSQATRDEFHQRSLLPQLVGKRGNGQESQQEIEDVRRLHRPKQVMP